MLYRCDDGNAAVEIEADTAEEAGQEYVDGGSWVVESTTWVKVYVRSVDEDEDGDPLETAEVEVEIDPPEPACTEDEHDWQSPWSIGLKTNPGVRGHGGGVTISEVCMHCGCGRTTDTWATNPVDGTQGHTSVRYDETEFVEAVQALREEE